MQYSARELPASARHPSVVERCIVTLKPVTYTPEYPTLTAAATRHTCTVKCVHAQNKCDVDVLLGAVQITHTHTHTHTLLPLLPAHTLQGPRFTSTLVRARARDGERVEHSAIVLDERVLQRLGARDGDAGEASVAAVEPHPRLLVRVRVALAVATGTVHDVDGRRGIGVVGLQHLALVDGERPLHAVLVALDDEVHPSVVERVLRQVPKPRGEQAALHAAIGAVPTPTTHTYVTTAKV